MECNIVATVRDDGPSEKTQEHADTVGNETINSTEKMNSYKAIFIDI